MTASDLTESIITSIGGFGRYQLLICIIIHLGRVPATWILIGMTFIGHNPGFYCSSETTNTIEFTTSTVQNNTSYGTCTLDNGSECEQYNFSGYINTIVTEWNLACDRTWIVGFITSLQMVGCVFGCIFFGYMSDAFGRKPIYVSGFVIIVIFNLIGYFSQSWKMFIIVRFVLGFATGAITTSMYVLMVEFVPTKWRSIVIAIPPIADSAFASLVWLLPDWRTVQAVTAIVAAPFLLTYWFLPESLRWMRSKGKYDEAKKTVYAIAAFNGRENLDLVDMLEASEGGPNSENNDSKYSYLDLLRTAELRTLTTGILIGWFSVGFGYYGVIYGVNTLSGNFFLNLFLVGIIDLIFALPRGILVNRFGRRYFSVAAMSCSGAFALVIGAWQYCGFQDDSSATTVLALCAKLACSWSVFAMRVYTLELYPTMIRSIGFGLHNTVFRLASAVVPIVLTLNDILDGILFFSVGVLMVISTIVVFFLPETADTCLQDHLYKPKDDSK